MLPHLDIYESAIWVYIMVRTVFFTSMFQMKIPKTHCLQIKIMNMSFKIQILTYSRPGTYLPSPLVHVHVCTKTSRHTYYSQKRGLYFCITFIQNIQNLIISIHRCIFLEIHLPVDSRCQLDQYVRHKQMVPKNVESSKLAAQISSIPLPLSYSTVRIEVLEYPFFLKIIFKI